MHSVGDNKCGKGDGGSLSDGDDKNDLERSCRTDNTSLCPFQAQIIHSSLGATQR